MTLVPSKAAAVVRTSGRRSCWVSERGSARERTAELRESLDIAGGIKLEGVGFGRSAMHPFFIFVAQLDGVNRGLMT
jgi:hypothetical protein